MNKEIYDVITVGAGCCGIFANIELMKNKKLMIIEAGRSLDKKICPLELCGQCVECRPICNILGGFGGSQFFEGTKLSRYPAGTGLKNFCKDKQELEDYYDHVDFILEEGGKAPRETVSTEKINNFKTAFENVNIDCKYYNAQKVSKNTMMKIGFNLYNKLIDGGVKIFFEEHVIGIEKKDNHFMIKTNKDSYFSKKVIISVGRVGSRNLLSIFDKAKINYEKDDQFIELGVRVEMPYHYFDKVNNIYNDLKLKRKLDNEEELRSFCQDYKGFITKCVYNFPGDNVIFSLDGHIIGVDGEDGKFSKVTNLAVHHRFRTDKNLSEIYGMINQMNKNNQPIFQTMKEFMNNKMDFEPINIEPSLPSAERSNLNDFLPEKSKKLLKEFITDINKVIPGFSDINNLIYGPSFEMGWVKVNLNDKLETNIPGVYVGGDITGHFRGAMQAMVSGLLIAKNLENEE